MARRQLADGRTFSEIPGAFGNQVSNRSDKFRIGPDRCHPCHSHPKFFADGSGFGIQVEFDLHVVRNKTNRSDSHLSCPAGVQIAYGITHVGFQPRL